MIKELENKKRKKLILIILIIMIMPAFLFWGFGGFIRSKKELRYAGKISGKKISHLEYKDAFDAVKNLAIIQFGDDFSQIEKYLNLEAQAWERLILLTEAKRRKIKVANQEVVDLIKSYPFFQKNGRFDKTAYSSILHYVFHTPAHIFEEQIRSNLMLSKLYREVTDSVNLTDEEIRKEYQRSNEEVSLYYVASLFSDFEKNITTTEEDLRDYFTKNSFEFKQPPTFNVEYISLESEDKLKIFLSQLNKKKNFVRVISDLSLEAKETGYFSQIEPVPGIGWSPQILNLISKLKVGEVSYPLQIDKNYYILRLKEKKESFIPQFDAIKDKVKEKFIKNKSKEVAKEKIGNCLMKLKELYKVNLGSVDFNKVAKEHGLKSGSTDLFKYDSYIEGIGASDKFWIVAQELREDEFSQVIEMPYGFYIVKLKSKIPMNEEKFETEKTDFTQQLLFQKKQEYFTEFLEELKSKAEIFLKN